MGDQGLFDEFPKVSAKQWKQKIQFDLKGADYNETLVWESMEGIKVKPFYHTEDLAGQKNYALPNNIDWKIAQTIYAGDSAKANSKALNCIKSGAESLIFTVPEPSIDMENLLKELTTKEIDLHFNFQFLDTKTLKTLLGLISKKNGLISINPDIIGNLVRSGNWFHNLKKDHELLEEMLGLSVSQGNFSPISVDTSIYQNSGANMVQQLAYGLAHANEYLNHFSNVTSSLVEKSFPITFKVAVSGNYFFEIAKLRALRWLWQTLASQYGIERDCHILAIPSRRNKTLFDYNVNMLRTTSECMSAVLGGANTVCNSPYDSIYHKDNEFAERISHNQLLLLKEESHFRESARIAEGSYYISSLTMQLAEKALALFKQIENAGGFLSELKKGKIQRKIKESGNKEQELFDAGKIVAVGTNKFENKQDSMKRELELYPFVKTKPRKTIVEPLVERRLSEKIEQIRLEDE